MRFSRKHLTGWFIPSRSNYFHPHLLRPIGLSVVVVMLLSVNTLNSLTTAHTFQVLGYATNVNASDVINLSNQERASNGLPALSYNAKLTSAAQAKAQDMFAKDYWAHNSPDGKTPWDFISEAGYVYITAGENLAKGFDTSAGVVQGWMNSPGHRANILNSSFMETGVAAVNGTLQGSTTTLVVAMYGSASDSPSSPVSPPASSTPKATPKPAPAPKPVAPATPAPAPTPAPQPESAPEPAPAAAPTTPTPQPYKPPAQVSSIYPEEDTSKIADDNAQVSFLTERTWGENATLFILTTVFLVMVLKHTFVWRTQKLGLRHIWMRAHPAAQYILLFVAIVANIVAGIGVVK